MWSHRSLAIRVRVKPCVRIPSISGHVRVSCTRMADHVPEARKRGSLAWVSDSHANNGHWLDTILRQNGFNLLTRRLHLKCWQVKS